MIVIDGAKPKLKSGFQLPVVKVGNWSVLMVLQSLSCCGTQVVTSDWTGEGFVGISSGGALDKDIKRTGVWGDEETSLVGFSKYNYRRGGSIEVHGVETPLDTRPRIIGITHRDGFITLYENGSRVWRGPVYENAITYFQYINGLMSNGAISNGQIAELKVYSKPFDDATMHRLYRQLDCKWKVSEGQAEEWGTCEKAKGDGGGGGTYSGSLRLHVFDTPLINQNLLTIFGDGKLANSTQGQGEDIPVGKPIIVEPTGTILTTWIDDDGSVSAVAPSFTGVGCTVSTLPGSVYGVSIAGATVLVVNNVTEGAYVIAEVPGEDPIEIPFGVVAATGRFDSSGSASSPSDIEVVYSVSGGDFVVGVPDVPFDDPETRVYARATKLFREATTVSITLPGRIDVSGNGLALQPQVKLTDSAGDPLGDGPIPMTFSGNVNADGEYTGDAEYLSQAAGGDGACLTGTNGRQWVLSGLPWLTLYRMARAGYELTSMGDNERWQHVPEMTTSSWNYTRTTELELGGREGYDHTISTVTAVYTAAWESQTVRMDTQWESNVRSAFSDMPWAKNFSGTLTVGGSFNYSGDSKNLSHTFDLVASDSLSTSGFYRNLAAEELPDDVISGYITQEAYGTWYVSVLPDTVNYVAIGDGKTGLEGHHCDDFTVSTLSTSCRYPATFTSRSGVTGPDKACSDNCWDTCNGRDPCFSACQDDCPRRGCSVIGPEPAYPYRTANDPFPIYVLIAQYATVRQSP